MRSLLFTVAALALSGTTQAGHDFQVQIQSSPSWVQVQLVGLRGRGRIFAQNNQNCDSGSCETSAIIEQQTIVPHTVLVPQTTTRTVLRPQTTLVPHTIVEQRAIPFATVVPQTIVNVNRERRRPRLFRRRARRSSSPGGCGTIIQQQSISLGCGGGCR